MNSSKTERSWNWLKRKFNSTHWTMIRLVRPGPRGCPVPSAEDFCRCYRHPLYGFLRQKGFSAHDAQDHVRSFLTELLARNKLIKADPARGQPRTYLINLLLRHISKRLKYESVQKRGNQHGHVPLPHDEAEATYLLSRGTDGTPEEVFRKILAAHLVTEGLQALEEWYVRKQKLALFHEILPALEGPLKDGSCAEAGERLGMRPGAVTMAAKHLRMRFKACVTSAASRILHIPPGPELDQELTAIFAGTRARLSV
ncbi:MAG: hypothetical protein V4726_06010 [Verrucomicrobiota bacterium]